MSNLQDNEMNDLISALESESLELRYAAAEMLLDLGSEGEASTAVLVEARHSEAEAVPLAARSAQPEVPA